MYDLNQLLVGGLRREEYLDNAWTINTKGWIVAGSQIGNGYILELAAVPEPESVGLLALGPIACAWVRARRK